VDEVNTRLRVEVSEDDLAIAIGRKGQNARLTSKLVGWKIDIVKEEVHEVSLEAKQQQAAEGLNQIEGIDDEVAARLVQNGLISPEVFLDVESSDLQDLGFDAEQADDILAKVNAFLEKQNISS
jgi:N utilization substance protein A